MPKQPRIDAAETASVGDPPMGEWAVVTAYGSRELVAEIMEFARHAATADHDGPCRFCGGGSSDESSNMGEESDGS